MAFRGIIAVTTKHISCVTQKYIPGKKFKVIHIKADGTYKGHFKCKPGKMYIQGVSRLEDITAGGDFLGLCDQKSSYKHVSEFGRLRSYDRLKLSREGNDY